LLADLADQTTLTGELSEGLVDDGFGVEVPALAALSHPQPTGFVGTREALVCL
jgi:hypothetical protein